MISNDEIIALILSQWFVIGMSGIVVGLILWIA
jgi:hypothetical protein